MILTLVVLYKTSLAQAGFSISAGIDLPELIHITTRFQIHQFQAGVTFGFLPLPKTGWNPGPGTLTTFSADIYYHFGKFIGLSDLRSWYGRFGVTVLKDKRIYSDDNIFLFPRIGRNFQLDSKMSINIDLGPLYELSESRSSGGWTSGSGFIIVPSGGIELIYRF